MAKCKKPILLDGKLLKITFSNQKKNSRRIPLVIIRSVVADAAKMMPL